MSTSILYIPADGDPHGVLADGLCGAKVPTAIEIEGNNGAISWKEGPISWRGLDNTIALPLMWCGELVQEAVDRLERRLARHLDQPIQDVRAAAWGIRSLGDLAIRELGGRVEVVS